jgi:hypothetical protein
MSKKKKRMGRRLRLRSLDIDHLWIYCIGGVVTVVILMIMVCYWAFRQNVRIELHEEKQGHLTTLDFNNGSRKSILFLILLIDRQVIF